MDSLEKGFSIKDGWLIAEKGKLGESEMSLRLVNDGGEQVEIYSPNGRQTVALAKLPLTAIYYLKALRDQVNGV